MAHARPNMARTAAPSSAWSLARAQTVCRAAPAAGAAAAPPDHGQGGGMCHIRVGECHFRVGECHFRAVSYTHLRAHETLMNL
eukprot:3614327-Prymnesium_polylepis.1